MPDVLPRRPYPLVLPPTGGFEDAILRSRRRRRHQATSAGAGLMTLVLGALGYVSLTKESRPDGLDFVKNPPAVEQGPRTGRWSVPTPGPAVSQPPPSPGAGPAGVSGGGNTGGRSDGRNQGETRTDPPASPTEPQPTRGEEPSRPSRSQMDTRQDVLATRTCVAMEANMPLCAVAETTDNTLNRTLTFALCRPPSHSNGQKISFSSRLEADFEVWDGNRLVWRWSDHQSFGPPGGGYTIDPGECVEWTTSWDSADDNDRQLEQGKTYTLRGFSKAIGVDASAEDEFTA